MSPVIKLTPGRCSSCGRFVSLDDEPDIWSVDVHVLHQQVPGEPNIWARTHCSRCIYVTEGTSWARPATRAQAIARARLLGQEVHGDPPRRG